jgi:hypothetical protein
MSGAEATPPFLSLVTPCLYARAHIGDMLASVLDVLSKGHTGIGSSHLNSRDAGASAATGLT